MNRSSVAALTWTIDILKKELQAAAQLVSKATDAITASTPDQTPSKLPIPSPWANSYVQIVRHTSHAIEVAHCNSQVRTICLVHLLATTDSNTSLNNLSEDVLVTKANFVLELSQKEDDRAPPPGAKFLSVRKTTHGCLLYKVDLEETTAWLRSTRGQ